MLLWRGLAIGIFANYSYFLDISFSRSLINIMNILNTVLIFTLEVFILCKKICGQGDRRPGIFMKPQKPNQEKYQKTKKRKDMLLRKFWWSKKLKNLGKLVNCLLSLWLCIHKRGDNMIICGLVGTNNL